MLTVAEQMILDAKATLNPDEMGSSFFIDGVEVTGTWEALGYQGGEMDGYFIDQRRYFVESAGLLLPVRGQELSIGTSAEDYDLWIVDRASVVAGMFEIEVTRNMS